MIRNAIDTIPITMYKTNRLSRMRFYILDTRECDSLKSALIPKNCYFIRRTSCFIDILFEDVILPS